MESISTILSALGFEHYALIIIALSIFIDINPKIKFNPIKAVFKYLGKWFNNSIQKEISGFKDEVNTQLKELKDEQLAQRITLNKIVTDQENKEISRLRWEVINFDNSIINGSKYSREQYRHVIDDGEKYIRLIEKQDEDSNENNDENLSKIKEALDRIKNHYNKHRQDTSILYF